MTRLWLISCLVAAVLPGGRTWRYLHNNDGTDILGNLWHGRRPLTADDVRDCVDQVAGTGVTTYLMCTGSDLVYYPSRFARIIGDDADGTLDRRGDEWTPVYYRNAMRLAAEGTDGVRVALERARYHGMETFLTYRMNDLHFTDPANRGTIYASRFWDAHPEYWLRDGSQGWNSAGALDFSYPEVREHKYLMLAEQLDRYADVCDGLELDFMRFIVYFRTGEGAQKAPLLTDLVRRVRAKADSVSAACGHRILLAARVPVRFEECLEKGLDVKAWLEEGLVDFLTLGVHWCGDPAIDAGAFRAQLGKAGERIPIYATLDDGGFRPREIFSHGTFRGMADFALAHGADGIYLFNYYLAEYLQGGSRVEAIPGTEACRTRSRELLRELGSARTLRRRNKILAWRASPPEYLIHSLTPLPLDLPGSVPLPLGASLCGRNRPQEAVLLLRTTCDPAGLKVQFAGQALSRLPDSECVRYHRNGPLDAGECISAFALPVSLLRRHSDALLELSSPDGKGSRLTRLELLLRYGDPDTHGYF